VLVTYAAAALHGYVASASTSECFRNSTISLFKNVIRIIKLTHALAVLLSLQETLLVL
jgi:hypothetical protein